MKSSKVSLPREGNEELCELMEVSNVILAECQSIQSELFLLVQPKLLLWGYRSKLHKIGSRVAANQRRWTEWDVAIRAWCYEPNFIFPNEGRNEVAFLHFTMEIRERANHVQHLVLLGIGNYSKRFSQLESRFNLLIALSSWFLTFLGLIASVLGLLPKF